ncbi:hypothetical protein FHX41_2488 [Actinomadura hallensis]|uniref:Uncharacterized protein n=1 Tax=Actinomadura hallensis TaxID=337895 RepID=A0A543IE76_9ACTN|nr:hypothetical protein FHX41_2488 [Actinomadura hallensis]
MLLACVPGNGGAGSRREARGSRGPPGQERGARRGNPPLRRHVRAHRAPCAPGGLLEPGTNIAARAGCPVAVAPGDRCGPRGAGIRPEPWLGPAPWVVPGVGVGREARGSRPQLWRTRALGGAPMRAVFRACVAAFRAGDSGAVRAWCPVAVVPEAGRVVKRGHLSACAMSRPRPPRLRVSRHRVLCVCSAPRRRGQRRRPSQVLVAMASGVDVGREAWVFRPSRGGSRPHGRTTLRAALRVRPAGQRHRPASARRRAVGVGPRVRGAVPRVDVEGAGTVAWSVRQVGLAWSGSLLRSSCSMGGSSSQSHSLSVPGKLAGGRMLRRFGPTWTRRTGMGPSSHMGSR